MNRTHKTADFNEMNNRALDEENYVKVTLNYDAKITTSNSLRMQHRITYENHSAVFQTSLNCQLKN